jgi:hypothetical protein
MHSKRVTKSQDWKPTTSQYTLEGEVAESPGTGRNVNKPSMTGPEMATSLPSEEYTVIPLSVRINRLACREPIDSALCIRIRLVTTVTLDEGR